MILNNRDPENMHYIVCVIVARGTFVRKCTCSNHPYSDLTTLIYV